MTEMILRCGNCGGTFRVQIPDTATKGETTCPNCGVTIQIAEKAVKIVRKEAAKSARKSAAPVPQPAPRPVSQSAPQPAGPAVRSITLHRPEHVYKEMNLTGLRNSFRDSKTEYIYVDGVNVGELKAGASLLIHLDANQHQLKASTTGTACMIPAGTDSYMADYFNAHFAIGLAEDPFRDALTAFVLNVFRGEGIAERILDPNNRHHHICLELNEKEIRLYWQVIQTKGVKQWSTGCDEEVISYSQAGLVPPLQSRQLNGYWVLMYRLVADAIEKDRVADMARDEFGGFTIRRKHSLY